MIILRESRMMGVSAGVLRCSSLRLNCPLSFGSGRLTLLGNISPTNKALIPPGQRSMGRFIIYSALGVPDIDVKEWMLKITGCVEQAQCFSYDELATSPSRVKHVRDFHCVTQWSVPTLEWEGVPIKALLQKAGVKPEAKYVMFHSADGYTAPVPLSDALTEDAIVAVRLNGAPLTLEQGFPARPFIPHLYGWKSVKWLTEMKLLSEYEDGYWERAGYHERGNVWMEERFKTVEGQHQPRRRIFDADPLTSYSE